MLPLFISLLATLPGLGFNLPIQKTAVQEVIKITQPLPSQKIETAIKSSKIKTTVIPTVSKIPDVPFLSQFTDIQAPEWKKVGCGVTSLAMVINYYKPDAVLVNTLLKQGIKEGAYLTNAGWTYKGLISLGNKYGLEGESYGFAELSDKAALDKFKTHLKDGPVIASIHYKFDPKSTIPHLVVINSIENNIVYYNDPAAKAGGKTISIEDFSKAWKKRFIVMRPTEINKNISLKSSQTI